MGDFRTLSNCPTLVILVLYIRCFPKLCCGLGQDFRSFWLVLQKEHIARNWKLDRQCGHFTRFTIQINLSTPLISKILIAGRLHSVEYELLTFICSQCGRVGHLRDGCPHLVMDKDMEGKINEQHELAAQAKSNVGCKVQGRVEQEDFGDWMVVE